MVWNRIASVPASQGAQPGRVSSHGPFLPTTRKAPEAVALVGKGADRAWVSSHQRFRSNTRETPMAMALLEKGSARQMRSQPAVAQARAFEGVRLKDTETGKKKLWPLWFLLLLLIPVGSFWQWWAGGIYPTSSSPDRENSSPDSLPAGALTFTSLQEQKQGNRFNFVALKTKGGDDSTPKALVSLQEKQSSYNQTSLVQTGGGKHSTKHHQNQEDIPRQSQSAMRIDGEGEDVFFDAQDKVSATDMELLGPVTDSCVKDEEAGKDTCIRWDDENFGGRKLKTGDLMFFGGGGFLSFFIRTVAGTKASHVGMVVWSKWDAKRQKRVFVRAEETGATIGLLQMIIVASNTDLEERTENAAHNGYTHTDLYTELQQRSLEDPETRIYVKRRVKPLDAVRLGRLQTMSTALFMKKPLFSEKALTEQWRDGGINPGGVLYAFWYVRLVKNSPLTEKYTHMFCSGLVGLLIMAIDGPLKLDSDGTARAVTDEEMSGIYDDWFMQTREAPNTDDRSTLGWLGDAVKSLFARDWREGMDPHDVPLDMGVQNILKLDNGHYAKADVDPPQLQLPHWNIRKFREEAAAQKRLVGDEAALGARPRSRKEYAQETLDDLDGVNKWLDEVAGEWKKERMAIAKEILASD